MVVTRSAHPLARHTEVTFQTAVDRWQTLHPVTRIALTDWWADRRLTLCHVAATQLSAPAQRLVGHLTRSPATTDC